MSDPRFFQLSHQTLIDLTMQEYVVNRPARDADDAADISIKSQILAGQLTILQHNQWYLLRQAFGRTADMPYLILLAEFHGINWDAGIRAKGWIKFARSTAAGMDYPITAGTVFISDADDNGNVKRVALLADVTLKTGEDFCWGWCEVIELQGEDLETYAIVGSADNTITIATQTAGSGSASNIVDSEIGKFEAAPTNGIETLENLSPGYSNSIPHLSTTTFDIVAATNDQIKVNIDGAGAAEITLAPAVSATGETIAADIQAKLRAVGGGGYDDAYCRYDVTEGDFVFNILSGTDGALSSVVVTAGTNDASTELGYSNPVEATGGYGFTGGQDPQSKESLRGELLEAVQNPGFGNEAFYKREAKKVTGVDDAKIVGVTGGVYIYPIKADGTDFSQAELDEIRDHIETVCPVHLIGSIIVINPIKSQLHSEATLTLDTGYTLGGVSPDVKTAMAEYVQSVDIGDTGAAIPPTVRINKLSESILGIAGIVDVSGLKLDIVDPPVLIVNYQVPDDTVAQLQEANIDLL